jgi:hypothetical protein
MGSFTGGDESVAGMMRRNSRLMLQVASFWVVAAIVFVLVGLTIPGIAVGALGLFAIGVGVWMRSAARRLSALD